MWHSTSQKMEPVKLDCAINDEAKTILQLLHSNCRHCWCAVTFGDTSIPVEWHVISGSCEPVLSWVAAIQLGIIKFTDTPKVFQPILMIDKCAESEGGEKVQSILKKYPENFTGFGRLKNYQIKLPVDPEIKPHRAPHTQSLIISGKGQLRQSRR